MMTKKTAGEVKAQVVQMLNELPDGWLKREIAAARKDSKRDPKTLEILARVLDEGAPKSVTPRNGKPAESKPMEGVELERYLMKQLAALERDLRKQKTKKRQPAKRSKATA